MKSALSILFSFFGIAITLLPAKPAHAEFFIPPQTYIYEGLTFNQPLTFGSSQKNGIGINIEFGVKEKLPVNHTYKKVIDAEEVISPVSQTVVLGMKASVTPSPSPTITPTTTPTPLPPTSTPSPIEKTSPVVLSNGGLDAEKLFTMSNEFRIARGLPPFQKQARSCELAASRAPEIAGEVATGNLHAGLRARNLDYWNSENIISMRSEEAAFNWWVNDKIHHDAIVGNYTYSCVACHGNSCAQEFTNFQPK